MILTNKHNVSLATAVWLATNEYDYVNEPNYISATSLMKPIKQICLRGREGNVATSVDVTDLLASRIGHAFHDSIERSWEQNYAKALKTLGYPQSVIDRVVVNPDPKFVADTPDCIPVYMEQRAIRQLGKWKVGGKFDFVAEGMVQDFKSTSTYAWTQGNKDDDYILQGSIYRWLNPEIITEDVMRINFIFKDWMKALARNNKDYPQYPVTHRDLRLLSLEQTEQWIRNRLALIDQYKDADESAMPECSDKELWRSEPQYKYYSDPTKLTKSTKNFDDLYEANKHCSEKGKGIVITVPGMAKRCEYCELRLSCKQCKRIRPDLTEE